MNVGLEATDVRPPSVRMRGRLRRGTCAAYCGFTSVGSDPLGRGSVCLATSVWSTGPIKGLEIRKRALLGLMRRPSSSSALTSLEKSSHPVRRRRETSPREGTGMGRLLRESSRRRPHPHGGVGRRRAVACSTRPTGSLRRRPAHRSHRTQQAQRRYTAVAQIAPKRLHPQRWDGHAGMWPDRWPRPTRAIIAVV
jgi:hypothetical protein